MTTKNIVLVATIVAVLGLLAAVVFGAIDMLTFGTMSVAVVGLLYGLINKFDNTELKNSVNEKETMIDIMAIKLNKAKENFSDLLKDKESLEKEMKAKTASKKTK